jgi:hypothetical protein
VFNNKKEQSMAILKSLVNLGTDVVNGAVAVVGTVVSTVGDVIHTVIR